MEFPILGSAWRSVCAFAWCLFVSVEFGAISTLSWQKPYIQLKFQSLASLPHCHSVPGVEAGASSKRRKYIHLSTVDANLASVALNGGLYGAGPLASVLTEGSDFEHRAVRHPCFSKGGVVEKPIKTDVFMSTESFDLPVNNPAESTSTTLAPESDEVCTAVFPFGARGADDTPFFAVQAGLSSGEVLAQVSLLLQCAEATAYEMCDGPDRSQRGLLWATLHSIEGAKGLIDALLRGASRSLPQ